MVGWACGHAERAAVSTEATRLGLALVEAAPNPALLGYTRGDETPMGSCCEHPAITVAPVNAIKSHDVRIGPQNTTAGLDHSLGNAAIGGVACCKRPLFASEAGSLTDQRTHDPRPLLSTRVSTSEGQ